MLCTFVYFSTTELKLNQRISAVIEMQDCVCFKIIPVMIIRYSSKA